MNLRRLTSPCALLALLVVLPASAARAVDTPYTEGELIHIQGVVTDSAGAPQAGKLVELEVYRHSFSFDPRNLGRQKKGLERRQVTTGADGRFTFDWPYFEYYNRYEIAVGGFVAGAYQVLDRVDLSRRVLDGSPVIVKLVTGAPNAPSAPAAGAATLQPPTATPAPPSRPVDSAPPTATPSPSPRAPTVSPAQEAVRSRQGAPDRIDNLELPYGVEVTWWYFARGKAYRFLDGELHEEMTFDPVPTD